MKWPFERGGLVMELLTCPCCAGNARFVDTVKTVKRLVRIGRIECKSCGLRTGVNTFGRVFKTWNRRVEAKAMQG